MALAVILFGLVNQPALADKRVALVIGNSAYENVGRLTNPTNDSSAMASRPARPHSGYTPTVGFADQASLSTCQGWGANE